jgi:pimeloyl-ACP methyl ester carboxylesterase
MHAKHLRLILAFVVILYSKPLIGADTKTYFDFDRPPGDKFSVGTHHLHLYCRGEGQPTVVIDAGLGGYSLEWLALQERIAKQTRVCVYDRAGYGWSDPGPTPRLSSRIAYELDRLLEKAKIFGPYVLVGHSFGGLNVRNFANRRMEEVAGIILVDASHEAQFERLEKNSTKSVLPTRASFYLPHLPIPENLPTKIKPLARRFAVTRNSYSTVRNELTWMRQSAMETEKNKLPYDFPVVILSRGKQENPHTPEGDIKESIWQELQQDLLKLGANSRRIIARQAGHHIHLDQPETILHALESIISQARSKRVTTTRWRACMPATGIRVTSARFAHQYHWFRSLRSKQHARRRHPKTQSSFVPAMYRPRDV